MADFTQTASAKAALQRTGSDLQTQEQYRNLINARVDEILDQHFGEAGSTQLDSLFLMKDQKYDTHLVRTKTRPTGTMPLNRDADTLPFIDGGEGFDYTFRTYNYRQAVKHERRLQEVDDVGIITEQYEWLMDNSKRTLKWAQADVFNRGLGAAGAPFVCLDGMYFIDSGRPNPDPMTPTWSNLEATSDITDDAFFQAQLNANNTVGANGDPLRLKIKKLLIPQAYEKAMWELTNTQNIVGSANNDANWGYKRFEYEVLDDLSSNVIYYELDDTKSEKNGLQMRWTNRPGLADIDFENPDVMGKRLRMTFGIGCLDPRYVWRGGALNAL
jgi:hypothetical protein